MSQLRTFHEVNIQQGAIGTFNRKLILFGYASLNQFLIDLNVYAQLWRSLSLSTKYPP